MPTKTLRPDLTATPDAADGDEALAAAVAPAIDLLRNGGIVAIPTETVYGLAANALDAAAVARVFEAKGRPGDNPLIVHISDDGALADLPVEVPEAARPLMRAFWPGPLTLVMRMRRGGNGPVVPSITTAGLPTLAVRVPAHPVARAILRGTGLPLAAPSANRSGSPSPTRAEHVLADLDGRIDMVVDAGPTEVGLESSVVDVTETPFRLLRSGGVSLERLNEVATVVAPNAANADDVARRSPGTRHRHYAPRAEVIVLDAPSAAERLDLLREHCAPTASGVGCLVTDESAAAGIQGEHVHVIGSRQDPAVIANRLYAALRAADETGYTRLYVEAIDERGIGAGIMDRLRRAAAGSRRGA